MPDPIEELAEKRLRELSVDVEVQLEKGSAYRPVLWLLVQARKRAAGAMKLFLDIDPTDAHGVRMIQIELKVYDDLVSNLRLLVARGKDADHVISEKDRDEMSEVIMSMSDDDRNLYQLQPRSQD